MSSFRAAATLAMFLPRSASIRVRSVEIFVPAGRLLNGLDRRPAHQFAALHLDEVFIRINGTQHYLWRGVDQHGNVLDVLIQSRRNGDAAKRFFRKLLKDLHYVPRVIVTDKLASYQVAHHKMLASVEHRRSKYMNNRARELASTDPTTRTRYETLHISRARATLPLRFLGYFAAFPAQPAQALGAPNCVPRWPTASRSGRKLLRPTPPPESEWSGGMT